MALTREEAYSAAFHAPKTSEYNQAREIEERIRLHTVGDDSTAPYSDTFVNWVKDQVSSEKFEEFKKVMLFPLPTVNVAESIFTDLSKVFEAENANFNAFNFRKESNIDSKSFNDRFDFKSIMKDRVFKTLQTKPNSFFVVDRPNPDKDPELFFVPLDKYLTHVYTHDRELLMLAWSRDSAANERVVLDDQSFHMFARIPDEKNQKTTTPPSWREYVSNTYDQIISEDELNRLLPDISGTATSNPSQEMTYYGYTKRDHNLGFVPADLIYKEFFTDEDSLKVKSPLATKVGELDWLLFWKLAKKVLDKSAPFPIYSHYAFPCSYEDPLTQAVCEDGLLQWDEEKEDKHGIMRTSKQTKVCPKCKGGVHTGKMIAGSRIEIPAPETKDDVDLKNPVQVLAAEEVSISYAVKEETRLESAIYYSTVGRSLVPLESFSASENQIDVAMESRKNVLLRMAKRFQETHLKIAKAYAGYLYPGQLVSTAIHYGDNWFLRTDEQEIKLYKEYTENSLPQQIKLAQLRQIIKNRFSTDRDERTKQLLLIELEPFPLNTIAETNEMYKSKLISWATLAKKVYFNEIIDEMEYTIGHLGSFTNNVEGNQKQAMKKVKDLFLRTSEKYTPPEPTQPTSDPTTPQPPTE